MAEGGGGALRGQIHRVLSTGVAASAVLLACGLAARAAGAPSAEALLRAGLTVLMLTPVLRVAWLAADCARRRDWPFLAASSTVLLLLGAGLLLGLAR